MEERTQTAFRLRNSLLERLKWNARRANKSVNAYVEEVLEETVGTDLVFPKLPSEFFVQNRELAQQFVLEGLELPGDYEGRDKELLADALFEKYGK